RAPTRWSRAMRSGRPGQEPLLRRCRQKRRARAARRVRPLRLGWLEERALLAVAVTNTNDRGAGSVRPASLHAHANSAADVIQFAIGTGVQTISPMSALPTITDTVTIDGYTESGASPNSNSTGQANNAVLTVELNGSGAGSATGLVINTDNSLIRGL